MKISILTPAFNAAPYLERAIQSVLAQHDSDFEHIVVDGGSNDPTVEILKRYPHLKWISEPDQGQCDAMNKAFSMCRGDVVTYLNADDWFEPGAFAHVRYLLTENRDADMVVGNLYVRSAGSERVRMVSPAKSYRGILQPFRYDFPLNPVSYFYRRSVQDKVGPFPTDLHFTMDYWFLLRAFMQCRVYSTDLVLGTFFLTGANKSMQVQSTDTPWRTVVQHLRNDNPGLLPWFHTQWLLHHWIRQFPERVKSPLRLLVYKACFAGVIAYDEYRALGFRRAYRTRFPGRSNN